MKSYEAQTRLREAVDQLKAIRDDIVVSLSDVRSKSEEDQYETRRLTEIHNRVTNAISVCRRGK